MSEWISVEDRLPGIEDKRSRVLVKTSHIGQVVASRCGAVDKDGNFYNGWRWGVINDIELWPHEVTHWMPLPEPPK